MSNHVSRLTAALTCVAVIAVTANTASAAPATHALALRNAATSDIETVQWRRGWGWGLGGFAAGAIIGGALAAPYYYGPRYYPYPYYPAYAPYPVYPAPYVAPYPPPYPPRVYYQAPAGDVGYCQQRYRTYDPRSGTYLGSDGLRHPCP